MSKKAKKPGTPDMSKYVVCSACKGVSWTPGRQGTVCGKTDSGKRCKGKMQ